MGYPTQQQKVDYLFKKIGFTKTKTGVAEDQTTGFSGDTKKAPPNEAIASPLVIPSGTVWSDSSFITTTPPTSDTAYVGVYTTATAYRMTVDTTVANERTFIARQTWGNPSSTIQGDWIDTQFGADYLVKVYMGDPSTGTPGVAYTNLSAAGTTGKDDVWFFDYSSGVLNFNGADLDGQLVGIHTDNVYLVGYRYIGRKGIQPAAGIGTFHDLIVSNNLSVGGISTFTGNIDANGIIEGIAGQNKIPSLYNAFSDLPNAGTYHGMFAHVHALGRGYFAHGGAWYELVNKESNGVVGTGTEKYNLGFTDTVNLKATGITTLGSIGISTGLITGPAVTYIDPATVGDDTGLLVVKGNLQVDGTQTTVNSSTMTVADKNIEMAVGAANDAAADGGGITVKSGDGDKTWRWLNGTDSWTSSEHIRVGAGKVFGFANDPNTFIDSIGNDTINFTTNGSKRISIISDGKVGIGSTIPSAKLDVNGDTKIEGILDVVGVDTSVAKVSVRNSGTHASQTGVALSLLHSSNTNMRGNHLIVDDFPSGNGTYFIQATEHAVTNDRNLVLQGYGGKVGIGSAIPSTTLDVVGVTSFTGDVFSEGNLEVSGISTFNGSVNVKKSINTQYSPTTASTPIVAIRNDVSLNNSFAGLRLQAHNANAAAATFNISVLNNSTNYKSTLVLQSRDAENDHSEKLRITDTGNIGIGITQPINPGHKTVHIHESVSSQPVRIHMTTVGTGATAGDGFSLSIDGNNKDVNLIQRESADMRFYTAEAEKLRITSGGSVGIGSTIPSAKLDVNGRSEFDTVNISETLSVSGISTLSKEVGIGSALNVVGVSTFRDDVTITKDKDLIFDRFGVAKTLIRYHDTLVVTQIKNVSEGLEIGYRPSHLMWLTNRVLSTKLGGIHVHGDLETDSVSTVNLNSTGISTFAGKVSAGGTTGTDGYYLKTTGIGVTWAAFPNSRTGLTTSATAGQTTFNFSYNVGYVDVFLNGVKLPASEFTASNGSTIILDDAAFVNDTLEFVSYNTVPNSSAGAQNLTGLADVTITGTPVIGETLQHNGSVFVNDYTPTATLTSTTQVVILSLPIATYRSVEYTIQITEGTKYHVTKILAIHDGTDVSFNEYGTLFTTSSLATFALDINSGNMRLLVTPASTNSTVFKVKFTGIKV